MAYYYNASLSLASLHIYFLRKVCLVDERVRFSFVFLTIRCERCIRQRMLYLRDDATCSCFKSRRSKALSLFDQSTVSVNDKTLPEVYSKMTFFVPKLHLGGCVKSSTPLAVKSLVSAPESLQCDPFISILFNSGNLSSTTHSNSLKFSSQHRPPL